MSKLISLIVVYILYRHFKNYNIFQKLQQHCNATWLDDFLFKAQMLANNYNNIPMLASTIIVVATVFFITLLLQTIVHVTLHNVGSILFDTGILIYCLYSSTKKSYSSIFVTAFEHNFSLLFWFALLGPIGLVLYWLFMLNGNKTEQANGIEYAKNINHFLFNLHNIAAWFPARVTGLIFSLVGDFEQGFTRWKSAVKVLNMPHSELLNTCGEAALGNLTMEQAPLLVERAFIAWVICCMLITLII